ncbi:ABC transporter ATP-binding protein [Bacteroidia bacterium]|nr:ABC transporter ATP-binding protein [Bacteroidia bacterium]
MKEFIRTLKYIIPYKKYLFLNLICNFLYVFFNFFSLTLIAPFVGVLFGLIAPVTINPGFSFSVNGILQWFYYYLTYIKISFGEIQAVFFIAILFIVFTLFSVTLRYLAARFLAPIRSGIVKDLRGDLNKKILSLPLTFFSEQRKGDLLSRITNDASEVDTSIVKFLQSVVKDPIIMIVFISTLLAISFKLMIIALIIIPLIGWIVSIIGKSLKRNSNRLQNEFGIMMNTLDESISGLKIIKSYNVQQRSLDEFNTIHKKFTKFQTKIQRLVALSSPLSEILVILAAISVIWIGGKEVFDGKILPEIFILFIVLFFRLIHPVKDFSNAFFYLQKGRAALARIYSIIDEQNNIKDNENADNKTHFENVIKFSDVWFGYEENKDIIKGINIEIKKGEKIAFIGSSGSGKTTLIDLLLRFYDVKQGSISIDNIDIRNIKSDDLHNLIGVVSQNNFLFNDTIFNNITFGKEATIEDVIDVAKKADAYNFIMDMGGFYAMLSDEGSNLSGGQRQRLNIARLLLKNPDIIILDEATSALDNNTEALIQETFNNFFKNKTAIIIAHRLSTIKDVDRILEIKDGKIDN